MKGKKFICLLLALVLLCGSAMAAPEAPATTAKSYILTDYAGQVIAQKNAHDALPPASVTKIMTLLLAMEALDEGRIGLSDMLTVSEHAASMGGSQLWLEPGEQMSFNDLLKCIAVVSANDASVAVAEYIAGSEDAFVSMMNQRAKELKMNDTNFVNCCGLPAPGHVTSAADIAIMSSELMRHPKILEYTTIWMDTVRGGKFGLANTNKLLKSYPGATGLKTGSTDEALFCLSATAEREGTGLIAVLMGCPTSKERFADAAALLNYGFANFTSLPVTTDEPIPTVPVTLGEMDYVHGELKAVDPLLMEKADTAAVTRTLTMEPGLTAPVEEGQQIGKLTLSLNGKQVAEAPVIASHGVARLGVSQIFSRLFRIIGMRTTA